MSVFLDGRFQIFGCAACVFLISVIVLVAMKIAKRSAALAILFSTVFSCALMWPLATVLNAAIFWNSPKMRFQSEIDSLNEQIALLKNSQISVQKFSQIAELALLQTDIRQTELIKKPINDAKQGVGILADEYYDEVLVALVHDMTVKYGIDFNKICVLKDENSGGVTVCGISPVFIGTSKDKSSVPVKEIRRIDVKGGGTKAVTVQNHPEDISRADSIAQQAEKDFRENLAEGGVLSFMDKAVVELGKNFISVILAPLYGEKIDFSDGFVDGALPILEFLTQELEAQTQKRDEFSLAKSMLLDAAEESAALQGE